jgi:hypothetical protein
LKVKTDTGHTGLIVPAYAGICQCKNWLKSQNTNFENSKKAIHSIQ